MKRVLVYGMTNNKGGIESYLMNYFRLVDRDRMMFDFVTDYPQMAYAEEAVRLGSRIYYIPARRESLFKHMAALRKVVVDGAYTVVYFNLLSASGMFSLLGLFGIKNIVKVVHSHNNSVQNIGLHRLCRPLLNALSNRRLACSKQAGAFMFGKTQLRKGRVTVVNNAIDCELFCYNAHTRQTMRTALGLDNHNFTIGHVGRLCYQKNTLFLIDVFQQLLTIHPEATLLIVGDGEDRKAVEGKIRSYGIDDRVMLLGMRDDVADLMQAMDVFLLPSRFEGLGIVLLEAQAAGLPCITSADVVPQEVDATGLVEFISLDEHPHYWAQRVLAVDTEGRRGFCAEMKEAGYCIADAVKMIEELLLYG